MRTNFWMGFAQVVLLLFAAAVVLIAAKQWTSPANFYRLAALAAVATIGGPAPTYPALQAQPPPAYSPPVSPPATAAATSYTAHSDRVVVYNITVSNNKSSSDSYRVTLRSSAGWTDVASLPASFALGSNSSAQFSVSVRVPPNANGLSDDTTVLVTSDLNGEQESSTLTTVVCDGCELK